jgi:regulator of replication initiation timing
MKQDLQSAKSKRNELDLENQRLKRELSESNLKREQWGRILKTQGVIP